MTTENGTNSVQAIGLGINYVLSYLFWLRFFLLKYILILVMSFLPRPLCLRPLPFAVLRPTGARRLTRLPFGRPQTVTMLTAYEILTAKGIDKVTFPRHTVIRALGPIPAVDLSTDDRPMPSQGVRRVATRVTTHAGPITFKRPLRTSLFPSTPFWKGLAM